MRGRRAAIAAAAAFGLLVVLPALLPGQGDGSAPPSSSYSAGPFGTGAYAELLERFDHPVRRLRGDLEPGSLDPAVTVVVLDAPRITRAEARHLAQFVAGGGRLVAGGVDSDRWLAEILDDPPVLDEDGVSAARPVGDQPETAGVGTVRFARAGSWSEFGELTPLLAGAGRRVAALTGPAGAGRVVALADAGPLQNRLLGTADNAGFGLALAGGDRRAVAFAEGVHGYGRNEGFGALPARWRFALAGLAVAALVWLWARGRRLGPPEDEARPLPPPRRAYVDALATTLAKAGPAHAAVEPVRARARHLVAERAGLAKGADLDGDALRTAATALGLADDEVAALLGAGAGEDSVMAAGRALARLNGPEWGETGDGISTKGNRA